MATKEQFNTALDVLDKYHNSQLLSESDKSNMNDMASLMESNADNSEFQDAVIQFANQIEAQYGDKPSLSDRFENKPLAVANPTLSTLATAPQKAPGEQSLEMLFPNLMAKSESYRGKDFLGGLGALGKNVFLAGNDLSTMFGRAWKDVLGLGRMQDVGADPQSTFEQGILPGVRGMIQGAAGDPTQLIGGPVYGMAKAGVGAAVANPLLSKLATGATTGGLLGQASNVIQSAAGNAEFDPNAGLYGAAGGMLGEGLGSLVGAGARKIGLMSKPKAEITPEMAPTERIKAQQQNVATESQIPQSMIEKFPHALREFADATGSIPKPVLQKTNQYFEEITTPGSFRKLPLLQRKGNEILSQGKAWHKEDLRAIGDKFNEIESEAFQGGIPTSPIKTRAADVVEKEIGYRPTSEQVLDADGMPVLNEYDEPIFKIRMNKVSEKGVSRDDAVYKEMEKLAGKFLKLPDAMDGTALRKLEIGFRDELPGYQERGAKTTAKALQKIVKGDKESEGSILDLLQSEVDKNPSLTPEQKATYADLRRQYAKELQFGDELKTQSRREIELENSKDPAFAGAGTFLNRLYSGAGDNGANNVANAIREKGALRGVELDPHTESRMVIGANQMATDIGKGDKRILHGSVPKSAMGVVEKMWEATKSKVKPEQKMADVVKKAEAYKPSPTKKAIQSVAKDIAPKAQAGAVYGGAVGASLAPGLSDAQAKKKLSDLRVKK